MQGGVKEGGGGTESKFFFFYHRGEKRIVNIFKTGFDVKGMPAMDRQWGKGKKGDIKYVKRGN